ncbi:MAG: tetratricopeptide repeat protein [Cyanobacteria bacterium SIG28]|nr:tetratricopeptide repeat protein [Cyanobacteria bacterium SIG28]
MKKGKKLYYTILVSMLIIALGLNLVVNFKNYTHKEAQFYIEIAKWANKHEFYTASEFYYRVAQKINPNELWMDFYVARNKVLKAQKIEQLTPHKIILLKDAIKLFQKEIAKYPREYSLYSNIGEAYYRLEDFDNAIKAFEKSISLNPKDTYSLYYLSYINCECVHNYEKALYYVDKYLELKPNDYERYFGKAYALSGLNRNAEAVEWYKKYLEHNPRSVAALVNVSGNEISLARFNDADEHINRGLELNPYSAYLLSHKVDVLIAKGDFVNAEKYTNQILGQNYWNGYIGFRKFAKIEYLKGNMFSAEEYIDKAKENAQEYFDKFCDGKNYDLNDKAANCRNRFEFIDEFEEIKSKVLSDDLT